MEEPTYEEKALRILYGLDVSMQWVTKGKRRERYKPSWKL